jgi:flagellar basal-body rod protein FlgC
MDYLRSFAISAAGMVAGRARLEAAAMNLSHAQAPQDPSAPAFQPVRAMAPEAPSFDGQIAGILEQLPRPPALVTQPAEPRRVRDAAHPLADADGYVSFAGVAPAVEMVSLMTALRSYEANVIALNTARGMALKSLDIGRAS